MKSKQEKLFYTIKEVADQLHINPSMLRYWEKEFPTIRPIRTSKGIRHYSQKEIEEIRLTYYLVKENGMTLSGAKKKLKENREKTVRTKEIIDRLKIIRENLSKMKVQFDQFWKLYNQSKSENSIINK